MFSLFIFNSLLQKSYKDVSSWSKYHVSLLIWRLSCQLGVSQTLKSPAGQRKGLLLKLFHLWTQTLFQANTNKHKNRTARSARGMASYWKVQLLIPFNSNSALIQICRFQHYQLTLLRESFNKHPATCAIQNMKHKIYLNLTNLLFWSDMVYQCKYIFFDKIPLFSLSI